MRERRWSDKSLGMVRPIDRRDFLNGQAIAIGSIGARLDSDGPAVVAATTQVGYKTTQWIIRRR
jgi:hypothetical protein